MPQPSDLQQQLERREDQLATVRSRVVGLFGALIEEEGARAVLNSIVSKTDTGVRIEIRGLTLRVKRSNLGVRQGLEALVYHPESPDENPVAMVFVPDDADGPVRAQAYDLDPGGPLADGSDGSTGKTCERCDKPATESAFGHPLCSSCADAFGRADGGSTESEE